MDSVEQDICPKLSLLFKLTQVTQALGHCSLQWSWIGFAYWQESGDTVCIVVQGLRFNVFYVSKAIY